MIYISNITDLELFFLICLRWWFPECVENWHYTNEKRYNAFTLVMGPGLLMKSALKLISVRMDFLNWVMVGWRLLRQMHADLIKSCPCPIPVIWHRLLSILNTCELSERYDDFITRTFGSGTSIYITTRRLIAQKTNGQGHFILRWVVNSNPIKNK